MTNAEILARVDHTLLSQTATKDEIRALCDDALSFGTASVCIPPSYVRFASEYLNGRVKVCTVIGFPNGYNTAEVKVFEAARAVADGADEIDMVINIGLLKDGKTCEVAKEIAAVREATRGKILKVIVETCLLNEEEKIALCETVAASGADFIKTSTGFSTGGATVEDVALMRETVGSEMGVKASGGIRTKEDALKMIEAGADRIGASAGIAIVNEK